MSCNLEYSSCCLVAGVHSLGNRSDACEQSERTHLRMPSPTGEVLGKSGRIHSPSLVKPDGHSELYTAVTACPKKAVCRYRALMPVQ